MWRYLILGICISIMLAGEVLVFTPKRVGKDFEAQKSFATIECGKWVGAARAAFAMC